MLCCVLQIPVVHKLMIKQLVEDENGEIWIVGTMVHHQVGTWSNDHLFEFRFNEESVDGVTRRCVIIGARAPPPQPAARFSHRRSASKNSEGEGEGESEREGGRRASERM